MKDLDPSKLFGEKWKEDEGEGGEGVVDLTATIADIFTRPLTQEEYCYLLSLYPYITVCDHDNAYIGPAEMPKRLRTKNGWQMFVYDSAICLGTNYLEVQQYQSEHNIKGVGTLSKQGPDAILEMLEYIKEHKKWKTIEIVFGLYSLQRATWALCSILKYSVFGFNAQPEDEVVKRWIDKLYKGKLYPPEYR